MKAAFLTAWLLYTLGITVYAFIPPIPPMCQAAENLRKAGMWPGMMP